MRIAIIGAGALGTFYGARLQVAGHEVHLLARSDAAIGQQRGFLCHSPLGTVTIPGARVHGSSDSLPPCDLAIVALKTVDNHALRDCLPGTLAPDGKVLVLQNGLGVEEDSAAVVGAERIIGGLCFLCANKVAPATVEHLAHGRVALAHFCPNGGSKLIDNELQRIGQAFRDGGIEVELHDDLLAARWRKLMWNIPYNGLCTVLNCDTKQLSSCAAGRTLVRQLMLEVQIAAAACGHPIEDSFLDLMVANTDDMGPYCPSMLLDRRANRPMEIEHIISTPLRTATTAGATLPHLTTLHHHLQVITHL